MATKRPAVPEVLTIPETAALLRMSSMTVYRLIAAGDLETCDVAPSSSPTPKTRVLAESVGELIRSRTRVAPKVRTHHT